MKKIVIIITAVIWIIAGIRIASADEDYNVCIQKCKSEAFSVQECIEDEQSFWDYRGNTNFESACYDLIRNEREYCKNKCSPIDE